MSGPPNDSHQESPVKVNPRGRRKWGAFLIRILVAAALLTIVLRWVDAGVVVSRLRSVLVLPTIGVGIAALFDRWLMAYKWNLLLRARGVHISHGQATRVVFIGYLLGAFTPGAIGADAYRVTALAPFRKTGVVVSTVVLERVIGLAVIGAFAAVGLPFSAGYLGVESGPVIVLVICTALSMCLGAWASLKPSLMLGAMQRVPRLKASKLGQTIERFYLAYADSRHHPRALLAFTLLTALEVVVLVVMSLFVARALGIGVSFVYLLCVIPLMHIIARLPISFLGIGVFEGFLAYFLKAAGFEAADGVAIAFMFRIAEMAMIILPAVALVSIGPLQVRPREQPIPSP